MANRYDRDPDDYGFGRRYERERDDEQQRSGSSFAQGNRFGENRPNNQRQNQWRNERERGVYDRFDRNEPDYRSASNRDGWREDDYRGTDYGRDPYGRDYSTSGRDSGERGQFDRNDRNDRFASYERNRQEREQPGYRGIYQESAWTRDPRSGNLYGYEYSTRLDPRRLNAGDESHDRWRNREDVSQQNRQFDIDRGWYTPGSSGYGTSGHGTSGYGNDTGRRNWQGHFGKGPKGYTRSDERIREDLCDRLSDDDEIDARDITVTVKNSEVTLEGTVNDRRSKHRAEDIAESISGVKDVSNHLRARKGFFQELGDKISGDDDAEHHGHRGSGTRNSTTGVAPQKTSH